MLQRDVKGRPARREELELRGPLEQRSEVGERPSEVLEVVDHREHARAAGERAGERLDRLLALLLVDAEARRDRRDDEVGLRDGGEVDERPAADRRPRGEREARLAGPPGYMGVASRVLGTSPGGR